MAQSDSYGVWSLPAGDYRQLDAARARDLVVECFMHAQQSRFAELKSRMGLSVEREDVERSVTGAVRVAFRKAGGDFDAPTIAGLRAAVDSLAQCAAMMGTPDEVVAHHRDEIEKLLVQLEHQAAQ